MFLLILFPLCEGTRRPSKVHKQATGPRTCVPLALSTSCNESWPPRIACARARVWRYTACVLPLFASVITNKMFRAVTVYLQFSTAKISDKKKKNNDAAAFVYTLKLEEAGSVRFALTPAGVSRWFSPLNVCKADCKCNPSLT